MLGLEMCRLPIPWISTFRVCHGPAILVAQATYMFAPGPSPLGSVCVMSLRLMYVFNPLELTRAAADAGADACLLVTPYYNRPTQNGLYEHFKAVAEAVQVPQVLYNVPGRTAVDMSNETVERLAGLDNIVGIKDATGDTARGLELIDRCGDQIAIYSGDDPTAMELILAGGKGNVSVTANVAPRQMAELCALAAAGDRDGASAINDQLAALNRALFLEANPIPVKWALEQQGLMGGGIRLPLTALDEKYHAEVLAALEAAAI